MATLSVLFIFIFIFFPCSNSFPEEALLRRHPLPLENGLQYAVETAKQLGIDLDATSPGTLQQSLDAVTDETKNAVMQNICIKPMQPALYFCTGDLLLSEYFHYALGVQFYTHFTSPIRRYADVVVHRLLQASIQKAQGGSGNIQRELVMNQEMVAEISENCNLKKKNAKTAQEASARLFLCLYIKKFGEIITEGYVCDCKENGFVITIPNYGFEKMVRYTELEGVYENSKIETVERPNGGTVANIIWKPVEALDFKGKGPCFPAPCCCLPNFSVFFFGVVFVLFRIPFPIPSLRLWDPRPSPCPCPCPCPCFSPCGPCCCPCSCSCCEAGSSLGVCDEAPDRLGPSD